MEDCIKDNTGAIRSDTQALRNDVATVQVNTEEILARVASLRNGFRGGDGGWTRQWVESMAVLSSYAESTYQETVIDTGKEREANSGTVETVRGVHADFGPISELNPLEEEERAVRTGQSSNPEDEGGRQEDTRTKVPAPEDDIHADDNPRTSSGIQKKRYVGVSRNLSSCWINTQISTYSLRHSYVLAHLRWPRWHARKSQGVKPDVSFWEPTKKSERVGRGRSRGPRRILSR